MKCKNCGHFECKHPYSNAIKPICLQFTPSEFVGVDLAKGTDSTTYPKEFPKEKGCVCNCFFCTSCSNHSPVDVRCFEDKEPEERKTNSSAEQGKPMSSGSDFTSSSGGSSETDTLSDKIEFLPYNGFEVAFLAAVDVKEFIKNSKDLFRKWLINHKDSESSMGLDSDDLFHHFTNKDMDCEICKEFDIDKLAGAELICN